MTKWNLFKKCKNVSTYKKTIIFFFLAKRFFTAGWERERAERAKRERERRAGA
jgi:hypothetical protein